MADIPWDRVVDESGARCVHVGVCDETAPAHYAFTAICTTKPYGPFPVLRIYMCEPCRAQYPDWDGAMMMSWLGAPGDFDIIVVETPEHLAEYPSQRIPPYRKE